jgi:hypothetical protein
VEKSAELGWEECSRYRVIVPCDMERVNYLVYYRQSKGYAFISTFVFRL